MLKLALIILVLFIVSITKSNAQSNTLQAQIGAQKSAWSGMASVGYTSNLQEKTSYDSAAYVNASATLNYKIHSTNLLRASLSGFKEQNHGQETKINDGHVGWANNSFWLTTKKMRLGQQVRFILPTSKESRVRDEKLLGVSVIPWLIYNLTPSGVVLIYQPSFIKNFHKYKQNKAFQNNPEFSIGHVLALNASITDKFYLEPSENRDRCNRWCCYLHSKV